MHFWHTSNIPKLILACPQAITLNHKCIAKIKTLNNMDHNLQIQPIPSLYNHNNSKSMPSSKLKPHQCVSLLHSKDDGKIHSIFNINQNIS